MAGIDKPDRLRGWHVRDGLEVGTADRVGARRLYTFGDVACLRMVNDLTTLGLGISMVKDVARAVHERLSDDAIFGRDALKEANPILIVRVEEGFVSSEVAYGTSGEAGVAAVRQTPGMAMVIVYDLGGSIRRTQNAYEALEQ